MRYDCFVGTEPVNVNCKRTFEGVYHFSYEKQEGQGGICESQDSTIYACQLPGSPYVDNQVFYLNYGKCRDVSTSREQSKSILSAVEFVSCFTF